MIVNVVVDPGNTPDGIFPCNDTVVASFAADP
jgi:hypothetical protein